MTCNWLRQRPQWQLWSLGLSLGILLLLGGAYYLVRSHAFQISYLEAGDLRLGPGTSHAFTKLYLANDSPSVNLHYEGLAGGDLAIKVDGQAIPLTHNWLLGKAHGQIHKLSEGEHILSLNARDYEERWLVTVDTIPPAVQITHPRPGYRANKESITLQGTSEPYAIFSALVDQKTYTCQVKPSGFFSLVVPTQMGECTIDWQMRDLAGNITRGSTQFLCDYAPPQLEITLFQPASSGSNSQLEAPQLEITPKDPHQVLVSKNLQLKIATEDPASGIANLRIYIDGRLRQNLDLAKGATSPQATPHQPFQHLYALPVLYEGAHRLEVVAQDNFGLSTKRTINFTTNTSERFGQAPLGLGALGPDVAELQRLLHLRHYLKDGYPRGKYDLQTRQAVLDLQNELGLDPDGIAGVLVTSALRARIYVNLARYLAVLVDERNQLTYYPIAIGVKEHPTPTGVFAIVEMVKDPTWLPPKSEWAKDAKQAPPGPNNPLGTRWIGFGNTIGFHGTPYPDTIGTPASHGCMRMKISDIEDLYERVEIGTPVQIFKGDEKDPLLRKYF